MSPCTHPTECSRFPIALAMAELPLGAHLVTPRKGYTHHAIYVGGGRVVHYAGLCRLLHRGPVEEVTLQCFEAGRGYRVLETPLHEMEARDVVQRARSRLGENRYRILSNNCEHFCAWCLHGNGRSAQVERLLHPGRRLARIATRALGGVMEQLRPQGRRDLVTQARDSSLIGA